MKSKERKEKKTKERRHPYNPRAFWPDDGKQECGLKELINTFPFHQTDILVYSSNLRHSCEISITQLQGKNCVLLDSLVSVQKNSDDISSSVTLSIIIYVFPQHFFLGLRSLWDWEFLKCCRLLIR